MENVKLSILSKGRNLNFVWHLLTRAVALARGIPCAKANKEVVPPVPHLHRNKLITSAMFFTGIGVARGVLPGSSGPVRRVRTTSLKMVTLNGVYRATKLPTVGSKRASTLCKLALAAAVSTWLVGCASYREPVRMAEASIPAAKLEEARKVVASLSTIARSAEAVALAGSELCKNKANRLPFFFFQNPPLKDAELRAAYVVAGLTEQPRLISTDSASSSVDGKFITKVGREDIGVGEVTKAWVSSTALIRNKQPVDMEFSDGTKFTIPVKEGCGGVVLVDIGTFEPQNFGGGVEGLSLEWFSQAQSEDERRFLVGRSLFYTSDDGRDTLAKGLFAGAALNGVLTGLTLGWSRAFIDTKVTVTRLARSSVLKEADAFGLRVAVRAGANPNAIMAFVRRMALQKEAATPMKELWFDDARDTALERVSEQLEADRVVATSTGGTTIAANNSSSEKVEGK